jgi:hypothetical protein
MEATGHARRALLSESSYASGGLTLQVVRAGTKADLELKINRSEIV